MNRRMPNGTYGGVRGGRKFSLLDYKNVPGRVFSNILVTGGKKYEEEVFMVRKILGYICILAAMGLLVFAVIKYYPKMMDYKKGQDLYNDLEKKYTKNPKEKETEIDETEDAKDMEGDQKSQKENQMDLVKQILENAGIDADPSEYACIDVDHEGLLEENEDYIGWIYIPKTDISYPVVQGENNEQYLHSNFRGEYNYPGTIFMDYRCKKGILNHHGILYGHNMRDGSMFAKTKNYTDHGFANEHPIIWFITPKYRLLYQVFSSYVANPRDKDAFGIEGYDFANNEEWDTVVHSLKEKSLIDMNVDVSGRDFTLTMSTCTSERVTRVVTSSVLAGSAKIS